MRHFQLCLAFASYLGAPSAFYTRHRNVVTSENEIRQLLYDPRDNHGTSDAFWDHRGIAFAKINLTLDIDPSSDITDSLLKLNSVMHKVLWGDHVSLKKLNNEQAGVLAKRFETTSEGDVLVMIDEMQHEDYEYDYNELFPFDDSNLIAKALRKARQDRERYMVLTRKRVLAGSGLGGGSADGAFVLKALSKTLDPIESLEMGSDNAFLQSDADIAFVSGRGEEVTTMAPLDYQGHLYILIPNERVSTPSVFKRARELIKRSELEERRLTKNDIVNQLKNFSKFKPHNALEACIENVNVKALLDLLITHCRSEQFGMSGSGSAFFVIGVNDEDVIRVRQDYGQPLMIVKTRFKQPGDDHAIFSYL
ncbi:4-diphosphocytidyl-2c-methyl-D-erythritol kinase [Babesia ovis]|uniref:4-diphosphocytidyl-2c-methyl-D-erythritol kinase n=1 Tax=Babesia ovis TaxID=5869 RepID=A0A9W5WW42_BABOV|nr:4-diphosphocytidyl-2c-methyl-D-erythritol kinase [Babesia ovis]